MASGKTVVSKWIATKAAADSALVTEVSAYIYDTFGPQDVNPLKYLVFIPPLSIRNVMMMGARIIGTAGEPWVIKMVGREKAYSELEAGAARIKALFHRGGVADNVQAPFPITVTGGKIVECYEKDEIAYKETDSTGVVFRHLGGLYFIAAQST
jgi:hypothetical protein